MSWSAYRTSLHAAADQCWSVQDVVSAVTFKGRAAALGCEDAYQWLDYVTRRCISRLSYPQQCRMVQIAYPWMSLVRFLRYTKATNADVEGPLLDLLFGHPVAAEVHPFNSKRENMDVCTTASALALSERMNPTEYTHLGKIFLYYYDSSDTLCALLESFPEEWSLAQRLDDFKSAEYNCPIPCRFLAQLGSSVCRALSVIHRHGYLYSKVSLENMYFRDDRRCASSLVLMAKPFDIQIHHSSATSGILQPYSCESEIFAVARLLFTCMYPCEDESSPLRPERGVSRHNMRLLLSNSEYDATFCRLLLEMLQEDRSCRPTAQAAAEAFDRILEQMDGEAHYDSELVSKCIRFQHLS